MWGDIFGDVLWGLVGLLVLKIAYQFTPRKRQIRARRRAIDEQVAATEQLSRDCLELRHEASMEMPYLRYRQDVCWIEHHTTLADPKCEEPPLPLPLLTPEQIAKDPTVGEYFSHLRWTAYRSHKPKRTV